MHFLDIVTLQLSTTIFKWRQIQRALRNLTDTALRKTLLFLIYVLLTSKCMSNIINETLQNLFFFIFWIYYSYNPSRFSETCLIVNNSTWRMNSVRYLQKAFVAHFTKNFTFLSWHGVCRLAWRLQAFGALLKYNKFRTRYFYFIVISVELLQMEFSSTISC